MHMLHDGICPGRVIESQMALITLRNAMKEHDDLLISNHASKLSLPDPLVGGMWVVHLFRGIHPMDRIHGCTDNCEVKDYRMFSEVVRHQCLR